MAARFDSPGSHGDASRATCCGPLLVVLCPVSNPGQAYHRHATEIPGLGAQGAKARVKKFCDCILSKGSLVEKLPMYWLFVRTWIQAYPALYLVCNETRAGSGPTVLPQSASIPVLYTWEGRVSLQIPLVAQRGGGTVWSLDSRWGSLFEAQPTAAEADAGCVAALISKWRFPIHNCSIEDARIQRVASGQFLTRSCRCIWHIRSQSCIGVDRDGQS